MDTTRREFIVIGGKMIFMTAATAAALEHVIAGTPEQVETNKAADPWWSLLIDIEKCIGCRSWGGGGRAGTAALTEPFYFRTWVERYHIEATDAEHPIVDSPNGAYDGFPEVYEEGKGKTFFVPKMGNHCTASPCPQVCPVGATFETKDGVVLVDKDYCVGCRYCVQACPYGCRYIDPRTHTADKCTLCYHRITKGLLPACVEVCPTGSRQLAALKTPNDPIHEFLRTPAVRG